MYIPSLALPDPWIRSRAHARADQGSGDPSIHSCASTNIVVEPIRFKHCLNCVFDDVLREYPQNYLKDTR